MEHTGSQSLDELNVRIILYRKSPHRIGIAGFATTRLRYIPNIPSTSSIIQARGAQAPVHFVNNSQGCWSRVLSLRYLPTSKMKHQFVKAEKIPGKFWQATTNWLSWFRILKRKPKDTAAPLHTCCWLLAWISLGFLLQDSKATGLLPLSKYSLASWKAYNIRRLSRLSIKAEHSPHTHKLLREAPNAQGVWWRINYARWLGGRTRDGSAFHERKSSMQQFIYLVAHWDNSKLEVSTRLFISYTRKRCGCETPKD